MGCGCGKNKKQQGGQNLRIPVVDGQTKRQQTIAPMFTPNKSFGGSSQGLKVGKQRK